ncbi:hypothetical protein N7465_006913 [Penicillium sp. CMV-2018d]|nr:hypothetical protein N7465_006913 [Penicillium sp. CMV-2018d]
MDFAFYKESAESETRDLHRRCNNTNPDHLPLPSPRSVSILRPYLSMDHVRPTVIVSPHEETEDGYRSGYLPGCIDILTKWARYKPLQ